MFIENERCLLEEFINANVRFAIIGGAAVALHGHRRERQDLDLLLDPEHKNIDRLADVNLSWLKFNSHWIEKLKRPNSQFRSPERNLDILTVLKGVSNAEVMSGLVYISSDSLRLPVISKDHLISAKLSVGDAKDLDDVEALRKL